MAENPHTSRQVEYICFSFSINSRWFRAFKILFGSLCAVVKVYF